MRITVMCLRNLLRRRLRTSLCIFGLCLATIFVVAIGATTTNYTAVIREMNIFFSGNVVVVAEGAMVIQAFPIVGGPITERIVEEITQVEGVKRAIPMLVRFGYQTEAVIQLVPTNVSIGIPPDNWSVLVGHTPLKPGGNWPSADPDKEEVVIGPSLAQQYDLNVGSKIDVENTNLTVAGILDTRSALLSRSLILPIELARRLYYGHTMWIGNMVVAQPEEEVTEKEVTERIQAKIFGVEVLSTDERNEIIEPLLHDVETWTLGLSGVLYLLSMILATTVAMMNVSERRKDFATLDAIGTPKSAIFRIVFTETALIGFLGGLAGILLGSIAAILMAGFYTNIPISMFFSNFWNIVSPIFMMKILVSTVAVSCVASIIPAIAASRINISEVLRSEY
jgi:putative ABC transport system permease protein